MRVYRKPHSPPPRRLGDDYYGPVKAIESPPSHSHPMTVPELLQSAENAVYRQGAAWERENPIELVGLKSRMPRIKMKAYTDAQRASDIGWGAIKRTQRVLKAIRALDEGRHD